MGEKVVRETGCFAERIEEWRPKRMARSVEGTENVKQAHIQPDAPIMRAGRFGPYGGRYVPETLMAALEELEAAYDEAKVDPQFQRELDELLHQYAGRPTPLSHAARLTEKLGGARIYLKREDTDRMG